MNNIAIKQNEPKQLERLSAQRELYSSAKKYHGFQIFFVVFLPILLSFTTIQYSNLVQYAAAYGVIIALVDLLFFDEKIKSKKGKAAKIQESFDCEVLQMEVSPLKAIDEITIEEVLIHYDAHKKIATNIEKTRNWYPQAVADIPISIARIICQRANCTWDSKLRERYIDSLKNLSMIVLAVISIYSLFRDLKFIDFVLLGSTLLPFFQFCIKQNLEQKEAIKRLSELHKYTNDLWVAIINRSKSNEQLTEASRRLQDEIFEHRSKTPLILDFFYKQLRPNDEEILTRTTNSLINELREKGIV